MSQKSTTNKQKVVNRKKSSSCCCTGCCTRIMFKKGIVKLWVASAKLNSLQVKRLDREMKLHDGVAYFDNLVRNDETTMYQMFEM